jgi:multicomponent Na+:H+ antiporter subunit E
MSRLILIALRMLIWLLLTADPDELNVVIGLVVSLALPLPRRVRSLTPAQLRRALVASLAAVPQAYSEAVQLLLHRRLEESVLHDEPAQASGRPSSLLVFLDVFRITITPFTIVLGLDDGGRSYRVHHLVFEEERR